MNLLGVHLPLNSLVVTDYTLLLAGSLFVIGEFHTMFSSCVALEKWENRCMESFKKNFWIT